MNKGPLSEPCLTIMSLNTEGISAEKQECISSACKTHSCDVLCLQETHRGPSSRRPHVPGMILVKECPHDQYGSALFVRPGIEVTNIQTSTVNNTEIITATIGGITISSIYKPPGESFTFNQPVTHPHVIIGDFNCRGGTWGYQETNADGELLESWAEGNELILVHDQKQPASFNSGRWRRGYNPDLIFVSTSLAGTCIKSVLDPIPRTQHRPIMLKFRPVIAPQKVPFKRRFNYTKAKWGKFALTLDAEIAALPPTPASYERFISAIKYAARQSIPRGCRTYYVPGLPDEAKSTYDEYLEQYSRDPFADETTQLGNQLLESLSRKRREYWRSTVESLDMKHSSRKAWSLIKKLSNDPAAPRDRVDVTANQIAHQLLLNGKPDQNIRTVSTYKRARTPENGQESYFSLAELELAINSLKPRKAPGPDDIANEFLQNLGPLAKSWLLQLFNLCWAGKVIPKLWLKARVVAVPKPGKPRDEARSYRPISLLCSPFKLYERLILNKIGPLIENQLIPQQAGFRPGKSCTGQILNLTQHIEDGFERREKTGVVFVDLSAAYDTINHKLLLEKVFRMTGNYHLTEVLRSMLSNRRFYVEFQGRRSRWRTQKNGLPQGSVLAPLLFNLYSNDQPVGPSTNSFIYADDVAIACQSQHIEEIERKLTESLSRLSEYYKANQLRPNPGKTQTCIFHLDNRQANRELQVEWNSIMLQHCPNPVYLGVTLDRTLSFKKHVEKTKAKVNTRNGVIRKLVSSHWGAHPGVLRSTSLAMCYAPAEYACPVWSRSTHANKLDPTLNDTCRLITGCLKPTNLDLLYMSAGIAPPQIRRQALCMAERSRQSLDERHPLYAHEPPAPRLKSRNNFIKSTNPLTDSKSATKEAMWKQRLTDNNIPTWNPTESLPEGSQLDWKTWKSLNRIRCQMGRSGENLMRWGYADDDSCACGEIQTMEHLLTCPSLRTPCTIRDLWSANDAAVQCARRWKEI